MNKNIRDMNIEEVLDLPTLGLDDTFEFSCVACGKCCKTQRDDILLTPYDLIRICKHLGRTPKEITSRYCEVYVGATSNLPIVRLKPLPPNGSCPFLHNRKCMIHDAKPVVCRAYPLARMFLADENEHRFILCGSYCKHTPKLYTVKNWVGDAASEESTEAGKLWMEVITGLFPLLEKVKMLPDKIQDKINSTLFLGLYLTYDLNQSFVSQLRLNYIAIKRLIEEGLEHENM